MAKKRTPTAAPSASKKQTRTERGAAAIRSLMEYVDKHKLTMTAEEIQAAREEGRR
jgi:hypothetical protein